MTSARDDRVVELAQRPTGVAVIRVWIEPDTAPSLRIRISRTLDITDGRFETSVATSIDEGSAVFRRWLEQAADQGRDGG